MMPPDVRFALPLRPPADRRIADRRRAAIARMVDGLAREMLAALRQRGAAAPEEAGEALIDRVVRHLALTDRRLTDLLGLRADTHDAAQRLRVRAEIARSGGGEGVLDRPPISVGDGVEASIVAYRLAESRRLGPFGEPRFSLDELDSATAAPLGWTIAAALRADADDDATLGFVADLLAVLPGRDAAAEAAAQIATDAGRSGEDLARLAAAALDEGWLVLGAALLGAGVGLDAGTVLRIVLADDPRFAVSLAGAAMRADRERIAALLLTIARARDADEDRAEAAAASWLEDHDVLDDGAAERVIAALRTPVAYREAGAAFAGRAR